MRSIYGKDLKVTVFGESHGEAIGTVVEGLPAGILVDMAALQAFLNRRAPGQNGFSTARREADVPEFTGGLVNGVTNGEPVTAIIPNTNVRSQDYSALQYTPRPGHADYTAKVKYGMDYDMAGGGHFSGRLTAPLCIAGGIALQLLAGQGVQVSAHIAAAAGITDRAFDPVCPDMAVNKKAFPVLCDEAGERMKAAILAAKAEGDSVGGVVECAVTGVPAGMGEHMFCGMENRIAAAVFGIPAVKGVEFGAGFAAAAMRGSEHNDPFAVKDGRIVTQTNHAGGILGGITNGMPLIFRCAFKPTPSIAKPQQTVDLRTLQPTQLCISGRHDPCIVLRALPVVEAVAALAVCDAMLEAGLIR